MKVNLGQTEKEMYPEISTAKNTNKNKMIYPGFHVNIELPLGEKDLNKEVDMPIRMKLKSYTERITNGKKKCEYSFDVMGMTFPDKKKGTPKSREEMEERMSRI